MTLHTALVTVAKVAAPMIPFMSESIYRNLVCSIDKEAPISVHLCDFPEVNERFIDKELEDNMEIVLKVVVLGRAARNGANIKNRQPIAKLYANVHELSEYFKAIIEEELNIKEVVFTNDVSDFTSYSFKPQLRILGQKFGKKIGEVREVLANLKGNAAKKELDATGKLKITLSDGEYDLTTEELLIETKQSEQYASFADGGVTVVIDTNLTPELIEEGFVREIISKIQVMRKDAGFDVVDHIVVFANGNEKVEGIMVANRTTIMDDVLADDMQLGELDGYTAEWNINGENVTLGVKKVN